MTFVVARAGHGRRRDRLFDAVQSAQATARHPGHRAPSDSCALVREPITGTMFWPFDSTQAIASCDAVAPLLWPPSAAIRRGARSGGGFHQRSAADAPENRLARWSPSRSAGRATAHHMPSRRFRVPEQREDARLGSTTDERVLDLQIADWMHRVRAADGFRADFGQADRAHVSFLDEIRDRADGLLDGHLRIEPARTIDVDVIEAEPRQTCRPRNSCTAAAARPCRASCRPVRAARRTSPRPAPCRADRAARGRSAARCGRLRSSRRCRAA